MDKAELNYWIDVLLAIGFVFVLITGILKLPILRMHTIIGGEAMQVMSFWHDWIGVGVGLLAIIHIVLHWNFFVAMTKKIFRRNKNE